MSATLPSPAPTLPAPLRRPGVLRRLLSHRLAAAGLVVAAALVIFCFLGPLLYRTDQSVTDLSAASLAPGSPGHPLGTDEVGHDVLGRLMIAGRTSLIIGLGTGLLATVIGTVYGAVAGYAGGWVDSVMMRIVDAGIAIPALFLLLAAAAIVKPSVTSMVVILGLVSWLVPARLVRAEALSLRTRDYVAAVRAVGGGSARIVLRHIVPNTVGTITVNATFQVADAILLVAYVSFLGLGVAPPATDWGGMLSDGVGNVYSGAWWLIFPPGIAIVLTVCAFNVIGDGLRDAFEIRKTR
ncbi:ABC transporter permease [Kineococcus sp. SYSU DK005]|uniref:ABC transporter permease n=1 Tax=Kineococcus sp. SYSU DK005 TaxID=3383126 RepID=UPI003D7D6006